MTRLAILLCLVGGSCGGSSATSDAGTTDATIVVDASLPQLTVRRVGPGGSVITSIPPGIACPPACVAGFVPGTLVMLTAAPDPSVVWSGFSEPACLDGQITCGVTVTADRTVVASTAHRALWSLHLGHETTLNVTAHVALDPAENVFVGGDSFGGTVDLGGGSPVTGTGAFLAKLDPMGAFLWSLQVASAKITAIATDAAGDVVVVGTFTGSTVFGTMLTSAGGSDIFVARVDGLGHILWSERFGGTGADLARAVAVDPAGNIFLAGSIDAPVDFGGGLLAPQGKDVFVVSLNPAGTHLWSARFGDLADQLATSIAVAGNQVYLGGAYGGTLDLGLGPHTAAGQSDGFIAALRADTGTAVWDRALGAPDQALVAAVAALPSGGVALTGGYRTSIDLGGGALPTDMEIDAFVGALDPAGGHLFSRAAFTGMYGFDHSGRAVAADGAGDVVFTGSVVGTADLGLGPILSGNGGNALVARYSVTGAPVYADWYGRMTADNDGTTVAIGADHSIVVGIKCSGMIDLGAGPFNCPAMQDMVIAKFAP